MSALAMAILLNGMDRDEIARWTAAMIASGERMDFSSLSRPTATSTPPAASATRSPCRSRRSSPPPAAWPSPSSPFAVLGHTGGTLDKLESIPGWRASLTNEELLAQLEEVGAVICAAGAGLAPADKKL